MRHLGLPPEPTQRDQSPVAASLDMLAAAAAVSDPPPPRESEGGHTPVSNFPFPMTCLYFGWEEKLELGVSSIMFFVQFSALSTAYSFCYRINVLANSRK